MLLTPLRNEGRDLKYFSIRSWLLDYASTHADTSPLNHCYHLPQGRKQFFWAVYYYQETQRGAPANTIGGLDLFLEVWCQDLPFIKLRTGTSTFIACGLCEYLKALAAQTADLALRSTILLRLGHHYNFQGAQRLAAAALWRESERDLSEVTMLVIDKMDQAKTITPRIVSLQSTQFMKGGSRLVVGIIGCLVTPWSQPILLSILQDIQHGSSMQCSALLNVLIEVHKKLGHLPRIFRIKANNTAKETKKHDHSFLGVLDTVSIMGHAAAHGRIPVFASRAHARLSRHCLCLCVGGAAPQGPLEYGRVVWHVAGCHA